MKCIYCGSTKVHKDGYTDKGATNYCLNCGKYFNDLTNTIFHHHKFIIKEMFCILKEMEHKSALEISKKLGRKYDSLLAFIREVQKIAEKIEYSIYEDLNELENVKEHRTVNHSKEYVKDGVHVNTAENRHGFLRIKR